MISDRREGDNGYLEDRQQHVKWPSSCKGVGVKLSGK